MDTLNQCDTIYWKGEYFVIYYVLASQIVLVSSN